MVNTGNDLTVVMENGLVPIYQDKEERRLVNARELHAFLGSKRQFGNWIQERIEKYGFEENVDFTSFNNFVKASDINKPNKTFKEYLLTIDTAKEIAMVENNEQGKQVRKYFIECEKQLNNAYLNAKPGDTIMGIKTPKDYVEAVRWWIDGVEKIRDLELDITRMKPKEEAFDEMMDSPARLKGMLVAKILNIESVGRTILYRNLREWKVWNKENVPYQSYLNRDWFECKVNKASTQVFFTLKGVTGIKRLYKKHDLEFPEDELQDLMCVPIVINHKV